MEIITSISGIMAAVREKRASGSSIGFVPTMGALHQGHLSLVKASNDDHNITITSIFVNPTQFNDPNDLKNYPRNFNKDCDLLATAGCKYVFSPSVEEMYPEADKRVFDFGEMGNIMEGQHRPGHFNGVAQIVTKLFDAVPADKAYFGQKDFQQLAIIRKLVADYNYPVEIIACPIIRENDGLAMSSRNQLLSEEHRKAAPLIYQTLMIVKNRALKIGVAELEEWVKTTINSNEYLKLEYFQFVDTKTLRPVMQICPGQPVTACIAVHAGKVRLIDNVDIIS